MDLPLRRTLQHWLPRRWRSAPRIDDTLWGTVATDLPFVKALPWQHRDRLRSLCAHFLQEKEFHGAHGLLITDRMALSIAIQACLPLVQMRRANGQMPHNDAERLDWYGDFVGIVVQPGAAIAQREVTDGVGVVHRYREVLAGEAMGGGPVMLSWDEVSRAGELAILGKNVVIHEFAHKLDMVGMGQGHNADGAPPLPPGFLGLGADAARQHWRRTMQEAYAGFREAVAMAERFGGEPPWLDDYAATDPAEFFAVTTEAYFVQRDRLAQELPTLPPLYDGFFLSAQPAAPAQT